MSGELGRALRWPLWSWRNLTVTTVLLLALLAVVGRATDGRASAQPAADPATSVATPTTPASAPTTSTPTTGAPTTVAPAPARPVTKQSATAVATAFVRAWATDGERDGWYAALQPWASAELLRGLAGTDPAQVPADEVVADARLASSSKAGAVVVVPTDGGDVQVTLVAAGGGWRVTDIAPADAPPAAQTPSLTRTTPGG